MNNCTFDQLAPERPSVTVRFAADASGDVEGQSSNDSSRRNSLAPLPDVDGINDGDDFQAGHSFMHCCREIPRHIQRSIFPPT